ncbi:hypothetical protein QYH69_08935 [Paraburkholderia sp. SARCC-3016]|jgi:hypothetical protein|uniref:hypothetical protein n=1 Tax=Paraburkholderia sp. SARCC-3016 TaxID=3058611 RepID=UPI002806D84E|nr:hypothetical protein [Paraburkholderia sp. SARCC-3016]MDQ7977365.1 hypothetical protein [Paraburkholderia sp. SARCC-3016]
MESLDSTDGGLISRRETLRAQRDSTWPAIRHLRQTGKAGAAHAAAARPFPRSSVLALLREALPRRDPRARTLAACVQAARSAWEVEDCCCRCFEPVRRDGPHDGLLRRSYRDPIS